MKAMVLRENSEIKAGEKPRVRPDLLLTAEPLKLVDLPVPEPGKKEILIKIAACGVCHTELDQIEGRIIPPRLPIIPGHQPVGIVVSNGKEASKFKPGDRVGVAWIFSSCGHCKFCLQGLENLCQEFKATGCHSNGGYAEYLVISEDYAYKIPDKIENMEKAAPLMCSGVVGYRSLKLTGMMDGKTLGLYGFGSAHHLVLQMANSIFPNSKTYVISRNPEERKLAIELGAVWAGDIEEHTPEKLNCAIDTTPAWKPPLFALENLERGGRLVINLIRKEEIDKQILLKLDYVKHLWMEKEIKTVANVTRRDAEEFLAMVQHTNIEPEVQTYSLEDANKALVELKSGKSRGSKVLKVTV
jgi:alcohol dehydrogenase, propanol-preferring